MDRNLALQQIQCSKQVDVDVLIYDMNNYFDYISIIILTIFIFIRFFQNRSDLQILYLDLLQ